MRMIADFCNHAECLSGVYTSNLLNDLEFYLDQILFLYEAKSLGKYLAQIFSFIKGQYLAQIKFQTVKQIGCVDAALLRITGSGSNILYVLQSCSVANRALFLTCHILNFFATYLVPCTQNYNVPGGCTCIHLSIRPSITPLQIT